VAVEALTRPLDAALNATAALLGEDDPPPLDPPQAVTVSASAAVAAPNTNERLDLMVECSLVRLVGRDLG